MCDPLRCKAATPVHYLLSLTPAPPRTLHAPAVECSHSAELNPAAAANWRPARGNRLHRPSNSLISTAVQPASPRGHPNQPTSPKLDRANSVVSHTARPHGRAETPASMYGPATAGFLMPGRARHNSPARNLAGDQVRCCVHTRSPPAAAAKGVSQRLMSVCCAESTMSPDSQAPQQEAGNKDSVVPAVMLTPCCWHGVWEVC